jgi:hypothetical protein
VRLERLTSDRGLLLRIFEPRAIICVGPTGHPLAQELLAAANQRKDICGTASEAILSIATQTQSCGARRVCDWVQLIRQQFQQTPRLCVTAEQASRLWGLEAAELEAVLSAFVDAHLLNRTRGGAYSLRLDPASQGTGSSDWRSC